MSVTAPPPADREQLSGRDPDGRQDLVLLPVAPQITARTRFAPAIPARLPFIMPGEALAMLERVMAERAGMVEMVAIAGPGDALGVPDTTLQTVELVKKRYPEMTVGIRTLGFGADRFAGALAGAGVSYVEIEVNAVTAELVEKIYAWIRPGLKTLKLADAAALLIREQKYGVPALKYQGLTVVVATTLYRGINIDHATVLARTMLELGADALALRPHIPVPDAEVSHEPPTERQVERVRNRVAPLLPLTEAKLAPPAPGSVTAGWQRPTLPRPTRDRPYAAVLSASGFEIDLHLGRAGTILIYGPREDGLHCFLETRSAPPPGGGPQRWREFADLLADCFVLCVSQAGKAPRQILAEHGVAVLVTDGSVDATVEQLYGLDKKKKNGGPKS